MTSVPSSQGKPGHSRARAAKEDEKRQPEWTNGLRRLYDSVLEEPLPDSFRDLLSQLDLKD